MSNQQTGKPKQKMSPELRRRRNLAEFWQQRYNAAGQDHGELARVAFDRARAAAVRARRAGESLALYELAESLVKWAEEVEQRADRIERGHAS
ncbi:hypothetical protein [Actinomadura nitritigenes]|uniref:hypothetical protein n=1 Tax=Actinomadura nitritigenes TaxID=134602 RepID=UPI003D8A02FC